jgi:alpha-galactosidase
MTVAGTPKIAITNTDNREIDNLRIAVSFLINGQPHFDYEDHGTFNRVVTDGLNAENGKWDGTNWVGNFLYTKASQSTQRYC